MRPKNLEEFVGQKHIIAKGKLLRNLIERVILYEKQTKINFIVLLAIEY